MMAVIIVTAIFGLWWNGAFLPGWIQWNNINTDYGEMHVSLAQKRVTLTDNENLVWATEGSWKVQDMLVYDINGDNQDELVLLVWKHGSYGDHRPVWVKHNDINIDQHIFIYQWDDNRQDYIKPLWMSSALGYKVDNINRGSKNNLIVQKHNGESGLWQWVDFGLKYVGENKENSVSITCVGDNLIHPWILKYEDTYEYLYCNIKDEIENADIAVVNQETMFVKDEEQISDFPRMGTTEKVGDALIEAGFDVICLANNHSLDKGVEGIENTVDYWERHYNEESQSPICIGANIVPESMPYKDVTFYEKNGIHFALLNYTYGTNGIPAPDNNKQIIERTTDEARMLKQIDYARAKADVVMVFVHWGTEYKEMPDNEQLRLKDLFYQHGVDIVVGSHPHIIQPVEMIKGKNHEMLIFYSLGNFVSGQNKPERLIGGMGKMKINKSSDGTISISDYELKKIVTHQNNRTVTIYPLENYDVGLQREHIVKDIEEYISNLEE